MGKLGFVKIGRRRVTNMKPQKEWLELLLMRVPMLLVEIENRHNPKKFEDTFNFLSGIGYLPFFTKEGQYLYKLDEAKPHIVQSAHETSPEYYNNFFFMLDEHINRYALHIK